MKSADQFVGIVVLGSHYNAYTIIRELFEAGETEINLIAESFGPCFASRYLKKRRKIPKTKEALRDEINELATQYDRLVIFPTNDLQVEFLVSVWSELDPSVVECVNRANVIELSNKEEQYKLCERIGVGYPKSVTLGANLADKWLDIDKLQFPIILKPATRADLKVKLFRNICITTKFELEEKKTIIQRAVEKGVNIVASEFIPGSDDQIYAYVTYRTSDGCVIGEWVGQKLSQRPEQTGVFASARSVDNAKVLDLGRLLAESCEGVGFFEPEFKYDARDESYKLMEINFRSMMWHRAGALAGIRLHAGTVNHHRQEQIRNHNYYGSGCKRSLMCVRNELLNLCVNPYYLKRFIRVVKQGREFDFGISAFRDPIVVFWETYLCCKSLLILLCLRPLRTLLSKF